MGTRRTGCARVDKTLGAIEGERLSNDGDERMENWIEGLSRRTGLMFSPQIWKVSGEDGKGL